MGPMRKWLLGALVAILGASSGQAAVWNAVRNSNCTAVGAATVAAQASSNVPCCTGASNGFCLRRESGGSLFSVDVDLVATGTYTANGDALFDAAALGLIGLGTIVDVTCELDTGVTNPVAEIPVVKRTSASTGYSALVYTQNATASAVVFAQVSGSIAGHTLHCRVTGY